MIRCSLTAACLMLAVTTHAKDVWVQAGYTGVSDGTSAKPYKHINDATAYGVAVSGDTVRVRNGTYANTFVWMTSGVTYKSENKGGAKLVGKNNTTTGVFHYYGGGDPSDNGSTSWWSQRDPLSWVTIDGFDISYPSGATGECHGIWMQWAHHITIKNNRIHHVPSAGVQTIYCDYITISDNRVTYCATWYQPNRSYSGITMFKNIPLDFLGGGYPNNFHNFVTRNYCNSNYQQGGSDGNGIIIDTNRYDPGTLVENNVCYSNGGAGIALDGAYNCTVRFNTLFRNSWAVEVPDVYATKVTWDSGAWNVACNNINLYGNVIDARTNRLAIAVNPNSTYWSCHANLRWHDTGANPSNVPNVYGFPAGIGDTAAGDDVVDWPQFVAAGWDDNANFRLNSYSPARNRLSYGTFNNLDLDKFVRSSPYDLGAFEYH